MNIPIYIKKYQSVIDHFGRWPAFHDSNVVEYVAPTASTDRLSFTLHAWTMTNEVDAKGFYVLKDHALVTFNFWGLSDLKMEEFNSGNILFGAKFSQKSESSRIEVELDSVVDMSGSFSAAQGEIASIIACNSDGGKLQRQ